MERDDLVDIISTLPDSILSLILSFVPTKNAVATSVLSKRWKPLWKAVLNLDFKLDFCLPDCGKQCDEYCSSKEHDANEDLKFACFVNHVMLLHDGGFLNMFRLVWKPNCIPSQVNSWISTAITRNVHELFLCLWNSDDEPFEIPASVFSCDTLQSLELNGNLFISNVTVVFLPKLKSLKVVSVNFQSEQALQRLISGCPMLHYLDIQMNIDEMIEYYQSEFDQSINVFTFKISSATVRVLKLSVKSDSCVDSYDEIPHCSLELEASSLEFLKLYGHVSRIFVLETLSSLVGADLDIEMCNHEFSESSVCNSLIEAVRALNFAVGLTLSRDTMLALCHATICLSTKFTRLIQLDLEVDCCIWNSLDDFIQSSDNLEIIAIKKIVVCGDDKWHHHPNWITPAEVPTCLSNKLETVIFYNYCGFSYEHEMIGYMLAHGRALKVIEVYIDRSKEGKGYKLLEDISELQRKLPIC